jgi:hypothetical protein
MIGSSVNPALGRIDYSPITRGAESAAQSIQAGGQAYGQMFSNLGNIGAQVFGSLAKQKKEEEQYKSIISSTKAFEKNVDNLKDVSQDVKAWVKKTTESIDDPKLSSMERANLAQSLNPMINSVVGSAINQSMASDARKRQGMELNAALERNKTAGIEAQLRTPGMTFEKLNASAEAAPEQTFATLTQFMSAGEALAVMESTNKISQKTKEAKLGLLEAQIKETLTPKGVALTDTDKELNDRIAAKQAQLGRPVTALERVELRDAMKTPTPLLRPGTKKDLILEDPETGNKKTVPSYWDGNEWRDDVSGAPVYLSPPGMFGGGGKTPNPLIFGRSSAPDVGAGVRDFGDLLNPKPKK